MSDADHEKRITRLEATLWCSDDNPDRGLVGRHMMTEAIAMELKNDARKIIWLLITAVLLAVVNLVLNKEHATPKPPTSAITSDVAKDQQFAAQP
jgi:hypothetical protein